jgi:hypothetical protein
VIEEGADQGCVEIRKLNSGARFTQTSLGELQKKPKGVPIARDRSGTCVLLLDKALGEEALQQGSKVGFCNFRAHFEPPAAKR